MNLNSLKQRGAFVRENGRWLGAGFSLLLFSSFGQTFFIGLAGGDVRAQFGLSGGGFGAMYMAATLASAATLPWLGRTLDVLPAHRVVLFTMPGLAAGCVLFAFAPNLILLLGALYLLRLFGQGMMTEIALTTTGRWFAANRGFAMALISPGLQAGFALLPLGFVLAHAAGGWRAPWIAAAALVLIAWPLLVRLLQVERTPRSAAEGAPAVGRQWTRAEVIADPILYLLLAGALAPPFIGTVIFFHQSYLAELRGYDPLVFAAAFPVMAVTTVVFGFVAGFLVDRASALGLLPYFLLPLAGASLALAWVEDAWGLYAFMFLLGVSNGVTQTLLGALWPEVYGTANLGGIRAITVSAMVLATAAGPGLTGFLIDAGVTLPAQAAWMGAWCLIACVVLAGAVRAVRARA